MSRSSIDIDQVIEMALKDNVSFESIELVCGLSEKEVIQLMKKNISNRAFVSWRKRVKGRSSKHHKKNMDPK